MMPWTVVLATSGPDGAVTYQASFAVGDVSVVEAGNGRSLRVSGGGRISRDQFEGPGQAVG